MSNTRKEGGPIQIETDERYLDDLRAHRNALLSIQKEQMASYDKAILSLSGGALGITVAFADKFSGGTPVVTWALLLAWAFFCLAIVSNVASYFTSSQDMEKEIEKVDASIQGGGTDIDSGNGWRNATQKANILAFFFFICGVALFGYHAYLATQSSMVEIDRQNAEQETVNTSTNE